MKQLTALLLCLTILFSFAACGGEPAKEPDLQTIQTEITSTLGIEAKTMNVKLIAGQRGFSEEMVAESARFTTPGAVFDDEIYMFKATDADAAATIAEKLNGRLNELKKQTQNYSPSDAAIVEQCTVLTNGNYVAMFFSANREQMETIYKSYF